MGHGTEIRNCPVKNGTNGHLRHTYHLPTELLARSCPPPSSSRYNIYRTEYFADLCAYVTFFSCAPLKYYDPGRSFHSKGIVGQPFSCRLRPPILLYTPGSVG